MAVANTWARGHPTRAPMPQPTPTLYSYPPLSSSSLAIKLSRKPFLRPPKSSRLHCCCSKNDNINNTSSSSDDDGGHSLSSSSFSCSDNWDWSRWSRHFSEIEQAERLASLLKFQLEEAVEKEDFHEAAKLKAEIAEVMSEDSISEIMSQLKSAISDERYHDASRLTRSTGSGLIGWWVANSKNLDDPFGRIIHITPSMGRFVGRNYSPRQLITSSPGTPIFEIFVVKEDDDTYTMQVVYLQQTRRKKGNKNSSFNSKFTKGQPASEIENSTVIDVEVQENEANEKNDENEDREGSAEEGIKGVLSFLNENFPELKVKVTTSKVIDEVTEDGESTKQEKENDEGDTISGMDTEEKDNDSDFIHPDDVRAGGVSDAVENEKDEDVKRLTGGALPNRDENPTKDQYVRIPAKIEDMGRGSFVLHTPNRSQDQESKESIVSKVDVSAVVARCMFELMPPDKTSDKTSPRILRHLHRIVKQSIKQLKKRNTLPEHTTFSRITTSGGDLDPFDGLYIGASGLHGVDVVQLRHKYGNWNVKDAEESGNVDFYEYVEAVKLIGDLHVPAGQVTFRAKIGKRNRLSNRGVYPEELGVVARYKGQARVADFGFENPKWVEGELLQFNGKSLLPAVKSGDLGFIYVIREQCFLVALSRLNLPT